jgi:uncharacterized protein (DUF362 family)
VLIKANAGTDRIVLTQGRQTELTEPAVVEAVVRAIRAVSDAEILIGDAATEGNGQEIYRRLGYPERMAKYGGVRMVDFREGPFRTVSVPGRPLQFASYELHAELAEIDACVSVAKMKAHRSLGCTLCIKNLFGLTPPAVYGAPRMYLHDRLIRLPRVLVDLAALFHPCLNVVDGIMTANHGEWHGTPIETGVLIAGDNVVSTDAAGMRVMGFDPLNDYPNHRTGTGTMPSSWRMTPVSARPTTPATTSAAPRRKRSASHSRCSRTGRAPLRARPSCARVPHAWPITRTAASSTWRSNPSSSWLSAPNACCGPRRTCAHTCSGSANAAKTIATLRSSPSAPCPRPMRSNGWRHTGLLDGAQMMLI